MRSQKPTHNASICLDFDGVLADFHGTLCTYIEEAYGSPITPEQLTTWDGPIPGTEATIGEAVKEIHRDPGVLADTDPVDGAIEGVQRLASLGFDLHVATHRPEEMHPHIEQWLTRHELDLLVPIRKAPPNKGHIDVDILVDDRPKNVREVNATDTYAIHHLQTWNGEHVPEALPSSSWSDIIQHARSLSTAGLAGSDISQTTRLPYGLTD